MLRRGIVLLKYVPVLERQTKRRLSEDWLSTYMKGVEGQIAEIVQLLHEGG